MKELSIEQKAKRYDEAIRKAKITLGCCNSASIITEHTIYDIFPELKESEDERIRKAIISSIETDSSVYEQGVSKEQMIAWLEKQDKQNTADKVKPKFKVGDWITYNHNPNLPPKKIIQITNEDYIFNNDSFEIKTLEADWHLWTIEDAKDGDVLYSPSYRLIWIYEDKYEYHAAVNCNYVDSISSNGIIVMPFDVCPANKLQRSILFQKIEEAGYTWNTNKKELKKIEQKSAWSKEDEEEFQIAIDTLVKAGQHDSANWLKSLKQRVQPQPKQEWSKEDWNYIVDLINYFDGSSLQHDTSDVISWLKSLKDRCAWKPSDE